MHNTKVEVYQLDAVALGGRLNFINVCTFLVVANGLGIWDDTECG